MGGTALAAVRVKFTRPATIPLRDGVWCAEARSICRRRLGNSFLATLRKLLPRRPHYIINS